MTERLTIGGAAAVVLGLLLVFGQTFGGGVPLAGAGANDPTATPEFSATSIPPTCVVGQTCPATATPAPSQTPARSKTHTPTATSTAAATQPASTPAPTNTSAPAPTQPAPGSGNEGAAVRPPNTGSGDSAGSADYGMWLIGAGLFLIVAGGGAAFAGIRQRR